MLQSSLWPGLLFHACNSAYVTRFPLRWRTVSSADRQYVPRTSISTPSMSKIRICGSKRFLELRRLFGVIVYTEKQGIHTNTYPKPARGTHCSCLYSKIRTLSVAGLRGIRQAAGCRRCSFGLPGNFHGSRRRPPRHIFVENFLQLLRPNRFREVPVHSRRQAFLAVPLHGVRGQGDDRLMQPALFLL